MAVSRVADEVLELEMQANPNPILAGENLEVEITVNHPGISTTGSLSLRLLWPEELSSSPMTTGGGTCIIDGARKSSGALE